MHKLGSIKGNEIPKPIRRGGEMAGPVPPPSRAGSSFDFLAGGGEMGDRISAFDWSNTPLGPISTWPLSERMAVGLCVKSRFPIIIHWGKDLIVLYNDAFILVVGTMGCEWVLASGLEEA